MPHGKIEVAFDPKRRVLYANATIQYPSQAG